MASPSPGTSCAAWALLAATCTAAAVRPAAAARRVVALKAPRASSSTKSLGTWQGDGEGPSVKPRLEKNHLNIPNLDWNFRLFWWTCLGRNSGRLDWMAGNGIGTDFSHLLCPDATKHIEVDTEEVDLEWKNFQDFFAFRLEFLSIFPHPFQRYLAISAWLL